MSSNGDSEGKHMLARSEMDSRLYTENCKWRLLPGRCCQYRSGEEVPADELLHSG